MKHTIYAVAAALVAFLAIVTLLYFQLKWMSDEPAPPSPTFTCAQTISPDSAAILSADLWDRASRGERTRIVFGCREGRTLIRMERVRSKLREDG